MKAAMSLVFYVLLGIWTTVTSQEVGQIYCGRRLATALALLCNNNLIKKSALQYSDMDNELSVWPWITPNKAHSMYRGKRQHGVVAECCEKPCAVKELLTYCGN